MGVRLTIRSLAAGLAIWFAATSSAEAASSEIAVEDNFFAPARVTVTTGDTLRWTFAGMQSIHTVTLVPAGGGAAMIDADVSPGDPPLELITGATGRFTLLCQIHSPMRGRVDVLASTEPTPPTISASLSTSSPDPYGTYGGPVRLMLEAADDSGLDAVELRTNGGTYQAYTGPRTFDTEGAWSVQYRATDIAGHSTGDTTSFTIDDVSAPVTTHEVSADGRVTLRASDEGGLGVDSTQYRLDGGSFRPYGGPFRVEGAGPHLVEYRSSDRGGNTEALREMSVSNPAEESPTSPFARLVTRPRTLRVADLARGVEIEARCFGVETATASIEIRRAPAMRLGLNPERPLARTAGIVCDSQAAAVQMRPARATRRALRGLEGAIRAVLRLSTGDEADSAVLRLRN